MFRDILNFAFAVIEHWATLATGGVIVGIIAFLDSIERPVRKRIIFWTFICFLGIAFFLAWRDENHGRTAAETDRNSFSNSLAVLQGRFDGISDALAKANAINKIQAESLATPTPQSHKQATAAGNDSVAVGPGALENAGSVAIGKGAQAGMFPANNSGNIASVNASPGATVSQSIVNPLPKPVMQFSELESKSVLTNGVYATTYLIDIENPADPMRVTVSNSPAIIAPMVIKKLGGGSVATSDGMKPWGRYRIEIVTSDAIQNTNIQFFVEAIPN